MASKSCRLTDGAFERSISPVTYASTTSPSDSNRSFSSAFIGRPPERPDHPRLGSLLSYDADRVHERLHEAQATSAVVASWLSPSAVVADDDVNLAFREPCIHLHRSVPRTIRVLDRVRDRFVAGKDDLLDFTIARLALR